MISVEEALARILGDVHATEDRDTVPLHEAAGRILACDLPTTHTHPPFDASAMDGFAVRAADCTAPDARLRLVGESAAGRAFVGAVGPGECVRIFTGAPMPAGADTVLIQENAERPDAQTVAVTKPPDPGRHIRLAGSDFAAGDILLSRHAALSPARIALAASGGHPALPVLRRPLVAVLATGNELVPPGEPLGPSQIVASNTFGVAAIARAAGAEVRDYGIAGDEMDAIGGALDRAVAEGVDVLVTIGGVSVGDHDLVRPALAARGVAMDVWKVAMRPGKPLMAGRRGAMRVLGLPGNPASGLVTAMLFLRPLVQRLGGHGNIPIFRDGRLGAAVGANDERAEFMRAAVAADGALVPIVSAFARQDSSLLSVFARADALLYRPPFAEAAEAGERCLYVPLGLT